MSAAHCCKASEHLGYKIYTGLVEDISKWDEGVQSVRVKRMIPHRKFATVPWSSDICLVELAEPLKQNEHMKFVRIPTPFIYQQLMDKKLCNMSLAMGFGYRGVVFENGTAMPTHNLENRMLQCVFQRIMNDEYCEQGPKGIDYSTTLCTRGAPIVTADTCRGDSGGPLICHGFQFGIVAAGIGCGLGHRSYFTKVAPFYQDFILKHVPLNESDGTQQLKKVTEAENYLFEMGGGAGDLVEVFGGVEEKYSNGMDEKQRDYFKNTKELMEYSRSIEKKLMKDYSGMKEKFMHNCRSLKTEQKRLEDSRGSWKVVVSWKMLE
ncbi:hypothetical protein Trydic_g16249 [Trypoxylus dichotomus]